MDQRELSEICYGLALKAKETGDDISGMFEPEKFVEPFDTAFIDMNKRSMIELKAEVGFEAIRAAQFASEGIPINEAAEYARALSTQYVYNTVGQKLAKIGKNLQAGRNDDPDKILRLAAELDKGQSGFVTMADVAELDESDIWVPAYYEPIDANAGGLPRSGLTIIAGPAKLGKTTLLLKLLAESARAGRRSAFFSLEMNKEVVTHRLRQIRGVTKTQRKLIHVIDEPMREDTVYAEASRLLAEYGDIGLIGIDYASKMLQGREASVGSMSSIYASCGDLAKNLGVPVVLIAGVNRNYIGGEVDISSIWYSGLAEHEASLIILIHNPALLDVDMSSGNKRGLPFVEGMGYIKFAACRYGLKQGTLGAAQVRWDDKVGKWGEKTKEFYPRYAG